MRQALGEGARAARLLAGILLLGYGGLVTLRILAHESLLIGIPMLVAGALLAWSALPQGRPKDAEGAGDRDADAPARPHLGMAYTHAHARAHTHAQARARAEESTPLRGVLVALLGLACAGAIIAYNALKRSDLSPPEAALLVYGLALLAASRYLTTRLGRIDVGTLVAWSLPLLAAPLGLWALDAALTAQQGASPFDRAVGSLLAAPLAAILNLFGVGAVAHGQTVALDTERGRLFLGIGLVCAGIHPSILFLGVFGLHAWQADTPPRRLLALLTLGLVGVYVANMLRLILLALVGQRWGGAALQTTHAHAGWILFVTWMIAFWWLVLRRWSGPGKATE